MGPVRRTQALCTTSVPSCMSSFCVCVSLHVQCVRRQLACSTQSCGGCLSFDYESIGSLPYVRGQLHVGTTACAPNQPLLWCFSQIMLHIPHQADIRCRTRAGFALRCRCPLNSNILCMGRDCTGFLWGWILGVAVMEDVSFSIKVLLPTEILTRLILMLFPTAGRQSWQDCFTHIMSQVCKG